MKKIVIGTAAAVALFTAAYAAMGLDCPWVLASKSDIVAPYVDILKANRHMPFDTHVGSGEWDNTLALNVVYGPILELRQQISESVGYELDFLKLWKPNGEAHVTTVTPVEYWRKLRPHLSMERVNQIARSMNIQSAELTIEGIGSAARVKKSEECETFFVIVKSEKLLEIRRAVHKEFVKNGGEAESWDPENFFAHITIGYKNSDLHESNGVIKDVKHSLDKRFN